MTRATPREDIAVMLREGATYAVIIAALKVSARTIAATRRAYQIPVRESGFGYRPGPDAKARIVEQTAAMLRAGATFQEIRAAVGITQPTIIRIRRKLGIPRSVRGWPERTVAQVLALHTQPYGEGHARWTGPWSGRRPTINAGGLVYNARREIFRAHHGRDPVGYVQTTCREARCLAGAHLRDGRSSS